MTITLSFFLYQHLCQLFFQIFDQAATFRYLSCSKLLSISFTCFSSISFWKFCSILKTSSSIVFIFFITFENFSSVAKTFFYIIDNLCSNKHFTNSKFFLSIFCLDLIPSVIFSWLEAKSFLNSSHTNSLSFIWALKPWSILFRLPILMLLVRHINVKSPTWHALKCTEERACADLGSIYRVHL